MSAPPVPPVPTTVPRRSFLKWSAAAGGGAALVGAGAYFGGLPGVGPANAATAASGLDVDRTVWSSCNVNCGSRCPLRMQVKDGRIVRVLPDDTGDDEIGTQLLGDFTQDRRPARLDPGVRRDALIRGCPPVPVVALIWTAARRTP